MKTALIVPEATLKSVSDFIKSELIPLGVSAIDNTSAKSTIRVVPTEERLQSDGSTLYSGGWITCADARKMAHELDIAMAKVGKLVDFLDIKVRKCELGCFK